MQSIGRPSPFTKGVIILIAIVRIVLGVIFLIFPSAFPIALGLPAAPAWTDWFAEFGARSFGLPSE
jgi:hypothetical protein